MHISSASPHAPVTFEPIMVAANTMCSNGDESPDYTISVASTFDEVVKAMAVRAAVYLGEGSSQYLKEFDGNDLVSTHLLALTKIGEPIATLRIRWFGEFAKIERMAIRREYRNLRILNALIDKALELCERKGFELLYGCPKDRVVPVWKRKGGIPCGTSYDSPVGTLTPMLMSTANIPKFEKSDVRASFLGTSKLNRRLSETESSWI